MTAIALAGFLGLGTSVALTPSAQAASAAERAAGAASGMTPGGAASQAQAQEFRVRANDLVSRDIVNQKGDTVGELEDVVADKNGHLFGVVDIDGIAGLGAKDVLIPVDQLKIGKDNLTLMSQKNEDDLKKMPTYDETKYTSVREGHAPMDTGTGKKQ